MTVTVRDARPGEGRRVEQIRVAGWQAAYAGLIDADFLLAYRVEEARVARREQWLAAPNPGELMLVAQLQADVTGFAFLGASRDPDLPEAAELWALYVDPSRRSTGVGSALLAAGFARMPQQLQTLWVLAANAPARTFYERHGFEPDGAGKLLDRIPGAPPEVRYRRARLA